MKHCFHLCSYALHRETFQLYLSNVTLLRLNVLHKNKMKEYSGGGGGGGGGGGDDDDGDDYDNHNRPHSGSSRLTHKGIQKEVSETEETVLQGSLYINNVLF